MLSSSHMDRTEYQDPPEVDPKTNALLTLLDKVYLHRLPSYGNTIFYGLGFLALLSFLMLVVTGTWLGFMGQDWWLHTALGVYVRSVHLWTVQAFILILVLHFLVGFSTSGFRAPRRMVWVFGALIFCLALIQTEFGYGLRGDFASQFRAVSGADFWNGSYLGYWLNPLNHTQTFILHVAIIPILIFVLFFAHYLLERTYGIAKPFRASTPYRMVDADHGVMYRRGALLITGILVLAFFFHSPYVPAVTIADVAAQDPGLVTGTLVQEFDRTSDTATYFDSIDPYSFDTRSVFFTVPYELYRAGAGTTTQDAYAAFENEDVATQQADVAAAYTFATTTEPSAYATSTNPVIMMLSTLVPMARSGAYESVLNSEDPATNYTYSLRFMTDMGIPEEKASTLNMATLQWGMVKDETGSIWKLPPGSWWLMPLALVNALFNLPNIDTGDRDAAVILGALMFLFVFFPYIPYLNRLPEVLPIGDWIQRHPHQPKDASGE